MFAPDPIKLLGFTFAIMAVVIGGIGIFSILNHEKLMGSFLGPGEHWLVTITEVNNRPEWKVELYDRRARKRTSMNVPRREDDEAQVRWDAERYARIYIGESVLIADLQERSLRHREEEEDTAP